MSNKPRFTNPSLLAELDRLGEAFKAMLDTVLAAEKPLNTSQIEKTVKNALEEYALDVFEHRHPAALRMASWAVHHHLSCLVTDRLGVMIRDFLQNVVRRKGPAFCSVFPQRWNRFKTCIDGLHEVCLCLHRDYLSPNLGKDCLNDDVRSFAYECALECVVNDFEGLLESAVSGICSRVIWDDGAVMTSVEKEFVKAVVDCYKTVGATKRHLVDVDVGYEAKEMILGLINGTWQLPC